MVRTVLAMALLALAACSGPADSDAAREAKLRKELAAASKTARDQLPYFWEHFDAPQVDEYDFSVKVAFPQDDGAKGEEQIWVDQLARGDEVITGQLAADPHHLTGIERGAIVTFTDPMITDWAFFRGEQLLGHYTTRVLLPNMPPEQAEGLRSLFGDNPE
jgi:uncharacterized protein YegJ (DUF2314 family)